MLVNKVVDIKLSEIKNLSNVERNKLKKEEYIGKVFKTKRHGECVVIDYQNSKNVLVKFKSSGYVTSVSSSHLRRGEVQDHTQATYFGVGVLDINGSKDRAYVLWVNMLKRCYSGVSLKDRPTYNDCEVSEDFKKYSNFKEWCEKQIGFQELDARGNVYALDKDILIKGCNTYSKDTCCFVPSELNSVLLKRGSSRGEHLLGVYYEDISKKFHASVKIGGKKKHLGCFNSEVDAFKAYKTAKESYIKELADKWKGRIDPRVYEALINYQVEITD